MGRLRCQLFGRLLQVGRVELREITRHALLQLCAAPFHFPAREVLVAGVDGFELIYRVPKIVTLGRFPGGSESDSRWLTKEAPHVDSDTLSPGICWIAGPQFSQE